METTLFERGSEWRKWDLHLHTPSSHDYHDKSVTDIDIIQKLTDSNIVAVAITDHHIIDTNRIKSLQQIAKDKVLILPGIEFCSELGGSESIHFIGIFSENSDIDSLWTKLQGKLALTPQDIYQKGGYENIQCDLIETCDVIHDLGGITSIHAGSKKNTIENIKNNLITKMQQKRRILSDCIDILELGKIEDSNDYETKVFPNISFRLPMIICSDNHDIKKYVLKHNCWIKADPTFEGLKQIIYEPEERIKIQEENPDFNFEKSPFTEIRFSSNMDVFNNEPDNVTFQECVIPLNNNLISIIGGRGTGKSILIDYIASGLGKETKSSFTKSNQVTVKRKTSLKDAEQTFILSDNPNIPFMYISQSQIKDIVGNTKEFTKNIRETIGVTEEYSVPFEYKEKAENYINDYFGVIKILEANNTNSTTKKAAIDKEIKRYNDFIINITSQENRPKLEQYKHKIELLEIRKSFYHRLIKREDSILQFEKEVNIDLQELNRIMSNLNLNIPLIDNKSTTDYIQSAVLPVIIKSIKEVQIEIDETKKTFENYSGDLATLLDNVTVYQNKVIEFQQNKKVLEDAEKRFYLIKQFSFKELGEKIKESITNYTVRIETQWKKFKLGHEDYTSEMKHLLSGILGADNLNVTVNVLFDSNKMYELLLQKLDGRSYSINKLKSILNISSLEDYYNFVMQSEGKNHIFSETITPDLRGRLLELFYKNYTHFISHEIIVTSNNKNITKLSHGQQGTIYLRMKLSANLFSETIVYDQPEDDLDNDFIMSDLVSIFRKIKKYRQVIIVSHNANLVVNADSEQIIIAKNEDGVLHYTSGSLEDTQINKMICQILEGGKSAFLNREHKYQFSNQ
ncbi:putative ATPase [Bacteroidales bacterium Barb7]|nr:putative ATPase [Bacteroidales bacterium Barb7]